MLTPLDCTIWILGGVLNVCAVWFALRNGEFQRYLSLNLYLLACLAGTIGEWIVFRQYGFSSAQYLYVYYYLESVLSVMLYFVVVGFYQELLDELQPSQAIRIVTILVLSATAVTSFIIVEAHHDHLASRFAVELGRNLNFVGGALTYILLIALTKLPRPSSRLLQMMSALGIYFCVLSLVYGVRMFHPEWRIVRMTPALAGLWLPAAWTYAFARTAKTAKTEQPVGQEAPALQHHLSQS